jgi:hypothetical protein
MAHYLKTVRIGIGQTKASDSQARVEKVDQLPSAQIWHSFALYLKQTKDHRHSQ